VDILQKEAIPFEEKAVAIIAREGHGSMRDALTLLDQAIALGDGHLNLTSLGSLVSNLSSSPYLDLIAAMTQKDAQAALKVIATLDQSGAEFASVVEETAKFARHGFVIKDLGKKALDTALLGLDDDEVARLNDIALAAPAFDLNRIFRTLCRCRAELDGSAIDRFVLENYVFEWCLDPGLPDLTSLIESQGDLGIKMGAKIGTKSAAVNTAPAAKVAPAPVAISPVASGLGVSDSHASAKAAPQRMRDVMAEIKAPAAKPQVPLMHRAGAALGEVASATTSAATPPLDSPTSIATLPGSWRQLVDAWKLCKPLQARKLEEVHPITFTPTLITIAVSDDGFASKSLLQKDEQNKILEQFRELFGFKGQLSVVAAGPATEASSVLPSAPNLINVSEVRAGGSKQEFAAKLSQEPPIFSDDPSVEEIPHSEGPLDPLLPDTLLTVKEREGAERRQKMLASAREAGLTQEVLAVFNASIEDVTIRE
jgi:DNA polymerase III gamma/tau subunit